MTIPDESSYGGDYPRPAVTVGAALERARLAEEAAHKLKNELDEVRTEKDQAYLERNHLVALLARLFPSGIRPTTIEGWNPEWNGCVYIDFPDGEQISYHYHESQAFLFEGLPPYTKDYNGHTKEDVHAALKKTWTWNRLLSLTWLQDWIKDFRQRRITTIDLDLAGATSPEFEAKINEARRITSHAGQLYVLEKLELDSLRYVIAKVRGCKPEEV